MKTENQTINWFVQDSVHGRIGVYDWEKAVIDTPSFQRLRRIKHLGLANFVFPSAEHTRFSHSLGTLHIMDLLCKQLGLEPEVTYLLRMAALLHDIGHYPLSHVLETAYRHLAAAKPSLLAGVKEENFLNKPLNKASSQPLVDEGRHELVSAKVIENREDLRQALKENGVYDFSDDQIKEITKVITFKHHSLLYNQLMNSDFDADRLDYLIRDAYQAGVNYGEIDLHYLIENLKMGEDPEGVCLCISREKGIGPLENFFLARYFMYNQIVFHKTIRAFEIMVKAIALILAEKSAIPNYEQFNNIIQTSQFLEFDDYYFWNKCREFYSENYGKNRDEDTIIACRLIDYLFRRIPLKCVAYATDLAEKENMNIDEDYKATKLCLREANCFNEILNMANQEHADLIAINEVVAEEIQFDFASMEAFVALDAEIDETKKKQLARIIDDDGIVGPAIMVGGSILKHLSLHRKMIFRAYVVDEEADKNNASSRRNRLKSAIDSKTEELINI